jgi:hypothetical protein
MHFELTVQDVGPNQQIVIYAIPHIHLELVFEVALKLLHEGYR